jgi:hypothetical protein
VEEDIGGYNHHYVGMSGFLYLADRRLDIESTLCLAADWEQMKATIAHNPMGMPVEIHETKKYLKYLEEQETR